MPHLLGDLVAYAQGYIIDFNSIKPKTKKDKQLYTSLDIEMKFNAHFSNFINYVRRLENISQFIKTSSITMEEMKDGFNTDSDITLVLSTLLSDATLNKTTKDIQGADFPESLEIERNPFTSEIKPRLDKEKKDYVLSGTTVRGDKSTCIINDEVYLLGDSIGRYTIKQIVPNMVVLFDGMTQKTLLLE